MVRATRFLAPAAMLPHGWAEDVVIAVDDHGQITAIEEGGEKAGVEHLAGPVIAGMANLHSHAFQRAMAGLAERRGGEPDSFWSWRSVMYGFLEAVEPEALEAIAAQLYAEMLVQGYTAVAEFHYLHHRPDGGAYDDPAEMSERIIAAAQETGIGLTLLPVFYANGGFGGAAPGEGQRRFIHDPDGFIALLDRLRGRHGGDLQFRLGAAPHSLRAVTPRGLDLVREGLELIDESAPIHIHVAEQKKEVEDCLSWSGQRPVEWLLDHQPVSARWCLVHATHMTERETEALARSAAAAGLCPTTEANLGDGFFPAPDYWAAGGAAGIGSDSHISVSPWEELRWLEYGQRLRLNARNVLAADEGSVGAALYRKALAGGAQAVARAVGAIAVGHRADLVVLDPETPTLHGRSGDLLLDAAVFSGNVNPVRDVLVGGDYVVRDGRHLRQEEIQTRYKAVLTTLLTGQ